MISRKGTGSKFLTFSIIPISTYLFKIFLSEAIFLQAQLIHYNPRTNISIAFSPPLPFDFSTCARNRKKKKEKNKDFTSHKAKRTFKNGNEHEFLFSKITTRCGVHGFRVGGAENLTSREEYVHLALK